MSWLWVLFAVVAMVAVAIGAEAWTRRGTRRPLSRHAVNQRRWSDPHRPGQGEPDHTLTAEHSVGKLGLTGRREWKFPKDPQEQAKALMPEAAKRKGKDND
ncbi:MAG TPA: hypothetical protein ENK45_03485 [Aliiroseovarius sp.]|nr:hypothetical protein [Aliiroseovarius sp.]